MSDIFDLDLDDAAAMRDHGQWVAANGGDKSECPVAPSHPMWAEWQWSWAEQRGHDENVSGAARYRTDLMKAEVRRQMEHLPEYQPDPCADVVDDPWIKADVWKRANPGIGYHIDPAFIVRVNANAQAVADAFEKMAQQMAATINQVAQSLPTSWLSLAQEAEKKAQREAAWNAALDPTEPRAHLHYWSKPRTIPAPTIDPIQAKRHGSAASCPKHGATRGGTCMKCTRNR